MRWLGKLERRCLQALHGGWEARGMSELWGSQPAALSSDLVDLFLFLQFRLEVQDELLLPWGECSLGSLAVLSFSRALAVPRQRTS